MSMEIDFSQYRENTLPNNEDPMDKQVVLKSVQSTEEDERTHEA
jgi:hypothetical protein